MNNKSTKPSILVVEDHPVFRKFLLSWLSRSFEVTAVRDGFQALKWLQAGNEPSVVVLDMEMPRIDGYQFLKNIRYSGLFSDLPVIALSGDKPEDVSRRCAELRLTDVFSKPYKPQELLATIKAAALATPLSLAA